MINKKKEESGSSSKESLLGDAIKKVVSIGVGAAFMTEDAVKGLLADIPLPKDILNGLMQNAKTAKADFTKSVREEVRSYLDKMDVRILADHLIEKYDIKIQADLKFIPKNGQDVAADADDELGK
ncbi:MAG: hypothetical protein A2504_09620 [Bdellovibrionales bacterium RIFOXYD12_FULL_39_22]|nr:MAG: hypothetical protein A2385_13110 [Bdellovibrionales bacterium RIFOXYB1_FULL_39_21]OFZ40985.1 MAG: hypothetical protein A2485_16620 [Bdellovibrionales bacterium RIFOXYC12_FULL_39_17]OFZ44813.1 MAG: hypothetical protein A2404_09910 [Bdellovibrionales bacterium RIFOXYC1_FULL_39_130]OFZ74092.1 MAG: hypothetical protein A2451_14560 [Bdellovibrionales bacterium RIFOXYC2_FULL_39_8]OFZ74278.1 MAG: hypothetical protein A2560_16875 [Bdellovibrionales bacterium RIFOXYD1_FULL_39_84]OFZ92142.1 MAG: